MASKPAPPPMALPSNAEGMVALKKVLEDQTRRTTNIEGLRSLRSGPNKKSVFLLDQYGVLHDGKVAYPCAVETVKELHESGARLFIISNSSRRASGTLAKLSSNCCAHLLGQCGSQGNVHATQFPRWTS